MRNQQTSHKDDETKISFLFVFFIGILLCILLAVNEKICRHLLKFIQNLQDLKDLTIRKYLYVYGKKASRKCGRCNNESEFIIKTIKRYKFGIFDNFLTSFTFNFGRSRHSSLEQEIDKNLFGLRDEIFSFVNMLRDGICGSQTRATNRLDTFLCQNCV